MDVYYSPEAIASLQVLGLLVTAQNTDGLIIGHERGPKIRIFKYKPKRGYKRRQGHRQELTRIRVDKIG